MCARHPVWLASALEKKRGAWQWGLAATGLFLCARGLRLAALSECRSPFEMLGLLLALPDCTTIAFRRERVRPLTTPLVSFVRSSVRKQPCHFADAA